VFELDHVLIAVTDLAEAAREIEARHGLASITGGRHPAWGTANLIVPLGDSYIELVAVADAAAAAHSAFGRWVARVSPRGLGHPLGWAVRTDELAATARRLGLSVQAGSRATPPDGQLLQWRSAGIEQAAAEPSLPFLIEWEPGMPHPGRATANHQAGSVEITMLELAGDADHLALWLGDHTLPITIRPGRPGLVRIVLTTAAGEVCLDELDGGCPTPQG
jgi:hypothetical protein